MCRGTNTSKAVSSTHNYLSPKFGEYKMIMALHYAIMAMIQSMDEDDPIRIHAEHRVTAFLFGVARRIDFGDD